MSYQHRLYCENKTEKIKFLNPIFKSDIFQIYISVLHFCVANKIKNTDLQTITNRFIKLNCAL
jgi:hypothetical protein